MKWRENNFQLLEIIYKVLIWEKTKNGKFVRMLAKWVEVIELIVWARYFARHHRIYYFDICAKWLMRNENARKEDYTIYLKRFNVEMYYQIFVPFFSQRFSHSFLSPSFSLVLMAFYRAPKSNKDAAKQFTKLYWNIVEQTGAE